MKKICLLIPCCNEEATVAKVVSDFRRCLPEMEIYVYGRDGPRGARGRSPRRRRTRPRQR